MRRRRLSLAVGLLLAAGIHPAVADSASPQELTARGKYLAVAADCGACHTVPDSDKAMSGGYAIQSPLGTIYASNITPSKIAGIGDYTEQDFARAVRKGINKQGEYLYPAMPYTSYARITDSDIHALYSYFMHGVAAVDTRPPQTHLPFPFSIRRSMALWNRLFATEKPFTPVAGESATINRGNYLVNALAHCDTCHTPRNVLMGAQQNKALSGGSLGSWYAPNITPDKQSGIGHWSADELAQYLRTGHLAGKAQAAGPMAEAVEHSLQYLSDDDIRAMVAYLQQIPAVSNGETRSRNSFGRPADAEMRLRGNQQTADPGWQIYSGSCSNCHQANGEGTRAYPALYHNSATGAAQPANLIATILHGVHRNVNGQQIAMPAFGDEGNYSMQLTDQQIADVSNYVLKNFGNPQVSVSEADVRESRAGGKKPPIAWLGSPLVLSIFSGIVIFIIILLPLLVAKRRRRDV